ncbi:aarF domain-containing protein kinase [Scenedesmus sp. PABB004]|nr:aarF domain-containing protein kinase [Scenedesmus sp. PABB004]
MALAARRPAPAGAAAATLPRARRQPRRRLAVSAAAQPQAPPCRPSAAAAQPEAPRRPALEPPPCYDRAAARALVARQPARAAARVLELAVAAARLAALPLRHERGGAAYAAAARGTVAALGPTWVKVAQTLSMRPDVIGEPLAAALAGLQEGAPPFDSAAAFAIVTRELGAPPEALFAELSPRPVASASLCQVHAGVLASDGRRVAVKVQRPGVWASVLLDLGLLAAALGTLRRVARVRQDITLWADALGAGLAAELDFEHEARNLERFASAHAHLGFVTTPAVVWRCTGTRVLTTTWIDGETPGQLLRRARAERGGAGAAGPGGGGARPAAAALLDLVAMGLDASLCQLLVTGVLHADPHAGNFMLTRHTGQLAYLDFGLLVDVPPHASLAMTAALLHLGLGDWRRLADDLGDMGLLKAATDRDALAADLRRRFEQLPAGAPGRGGPGDAPPPSLLAPRLGSYGEFARVIASLSVAYRFELPPYYTLIIRSLSTLEGFALAADPGAAQRLVGAAVRAVARQLLADARPGAQRLLSQVLAAPGGGGGGGGGGPLNLALLAELLELLREPAPGAGGGRRAAAAAPAPRQPVGAWAALAAFSPAAVARQLLAAPQAANVRRGVVEQLVASASRPRRPATSWDAPHSAVQRTAPPHNRRRHGAGPVSPLPPRAHDRARERPACAMSAAEADGGKGVLTFALAPRRGGDKAGGDKPTSTALRYVLPVSVYAIVAAFVLLGWGAGSWSGGRMKPAPVEAGIRPRLATAMEKLSGADLQSLRFRMLVTQRPVVLATCVDCPCGIVCDLISGAPAGRGWPRLAAAGRSSRSWPQLAQLAQRALFELPQARLEPAAQLGAAKLPAARSARARPGRSAQHARRALTHAPPPSPARRRAENRLYAPVESWLFEHIWSVTPARERVLVDVGANVGYFSMLSAAWGAKALAFEPNPEARRLLEISAALQPNVRNIRVFPYAIAHRAGTASVAVPPRGWAFGQVELAKNPKKDREAEQGGGDGDNAAAADDDDAPPTYGTTLKAVTLADYVRGPVDTEGSEAGVFEGAWEVLPNVQYLITEVKDVNEPAKRELLREIMRVGGFRHVYNYKEIYAATQQYPPPGATLVDVSAQVAKKGGDAAALAHESFAFSRSPLDAALPITAPQ